MAFFLKNCVRWQLFCNLQSYITINCTPCITVFGCKVYSKSLKLLTSVVDYNQLYNNFDLTHWILRQTQCTYQTQLIRLQLIIQENFYPSLNFYCNFKILHTKRSLLQIYTPCGFPVPVEEYIIGYDVFRIFNSSLGLTSSCGLINIVVCLGDQ